MIFYQKKRWLDQGLSGRTTKNNFFCSFPTDSFINSSVIHFKILQSKTTNFILILIINVFNN